jgi:hypothetical protein
MLSGFADLDDLVRSSGCPRATAQGRPKGGCGPGSRVNWLRGHSADAHPATTKDDHFDRRAKTTQTQRLVARLHNLGYAVQIMPLAA